MRPLFFVPVHQVQNGTRADLAFQDAAVGLSDGLVGVFIHQPFSRSARLGIVHLFGVEESLVGKIEFLVGQEAGTGKVR